MKIKILVLNINDLGGIERVALNLYKIFNVHIKNGDIEIISILDSKSTVSGRSLKGRNEFSKLVSFSRELDADTIVLSLYDRFSIQLALIRKVLNFKYKLYACQHADYYAHRIHTRLMRRVAYHWVDKIISLTKQDGCLYSKIFRNVHVIPNPLSFYPDKVKNFSDRTIDAAVAGRLTRIKQFEHFVSVLSKISIENTILSGNYKVFGDGVERDNLRQKLLRSGLNADEIMAGRRDNLEEDLSDVKVVFVTSLRESFSMVILEAMACGCVVISYDCPTGPRELILDGVNGFLVNLNDIDGLVAVYNKIMLNPDLAQKVSYGARDSSRAFSEMFVFNLWEKLFNE